MSAGLVVLTEEQLEALVERAVRKAAAPVAPSVEPNEILTREQVARLLQVNVHTVPSLIKRGLPAHLLGTKWRFRRTEVLAWLVAQKGAA